MGASGGWGFSEENAVVTRGRASWLPASSLSDFRAWIRLDGTPVELGTDLCLLEAQPGLKPAPLLTAQPGLPAQRMGAPAIVRCSVLPVLLLLFFYCFLDARLAAASSLSRFTNSSTQQILTPGPGMEKSCSQVRRIFTLKHLGNADMVPDTPGNGHDLTICTTHSSCCTKETEARFYEAVKKDFLKIMQDTSSYLKNLISSRVAAFQDSFMGMVRVSENNTSVLFSEVYKRMAGPTQELIRKMYSNLGDFLHGKEVNLESTVTDFFDGLFPLVYHHSINPKLNDFNEDYKECLQETQMELKPFGDIPVRISASVSKSFLAARTFLHALHLGVEVINSTDHLDVAVECQRSLMRLLYCPLCQGLVSAKSCNGYCMNVVRGCLSNMAEMDQPWNEYLVALDKLTASMKAGSILEDVTSSLDTKISEAIMYAMENGPELSKKVKKACGHPKRSTRDALGGVLETNTSGKIVSVHSLNPTLYTQIQTFMRNMLQSKGFYAGLADTLCNEDNLAVRSEKNCWNGDALGEYSKTIAGVGLSAQKYNPELKMQHWRDSKLAHLIDKLKHMRQIMNSRTVSLPESDSLLVNDGSGSGWTYNNNQENTDDEDYSYGSADGSDLGSSGDGYPRSSDKKPRVKPAESDIGFEDGSGYKTPSITTRPQNSACSTGALWLLVTAMLLASSSLNWMNG